LARAWRLSRVIKQLKPDLIHAHDPLAVTMAATALSIAEQHRSRSWSRPAGQSSASSTRRFHAGHTRRWDGFIANSRVIGDRLVTEGVPRAKITIVNEGVDVDRIERLQPANVRAAFYLPVQAPVVGNVAALVPHKGQHYPYRRRSDRGPSGPRRAFRHRRRR
jgi:hypothetical protein